eukprot:scaffold42728_cov27-Tisochrysis_lutea.AAC.4
MLPLPERRFKRAAGCRTTARAAERHDDEELEEEKREQHRSARGRRPTHPRSGSLARSQAPSHYTIGSVRIDFNERFLADFSGEKSLVKCCL